MVEGSNSGSGGHLGMAAVIGVVRQGGRRYSVADSGSSGTGSMPDAD